MNCPSCQLVSINGVLCHETDCPHAWRGNQRECSWCDAKFLPEQFMQECCSHTCHVAWSGCNCACDECGVELILPDAEDTQ